MAIDASIYGNIQQPASPLDQYGKALQLKALMGQSKLQELQTTKAERDLNEEQALHDVFNRAQPGATLESLLPDVYKASPKAGVEFQGKLLKNKEAQGHIDLSQMKLSTEAAQQHREQLASVNTPQDAAQWVQSGYADPHLAPILSRGGTVEQAVARIPQDPQQFQQWKAQNGMGIQKFLETQNTNANAAAGRDVTTRGQDLTEARARDEGEANRANRRLVAGVDENGKPLNSLPEGTIDLAKVSPVDLEAAYRYYSDGTLPPNMGRGQQGMAESRRIRSIAAQIGQSLGISPEDARANQLAFKGSGQAITQLVRREAQIGANVRNFDFNANQVMDLSQKVDRTGIPVVNAWMNAGRRAVQGNPELSAFDVAVKTTVNEFAQIVSGTTAGATTEGEKQKAEKLLNAAQTPAQITAVINQMRIESQNRMKSFADQKRETLNGMRAGGKPKETEAPKAAPAAAAPTKLKGWSIEEVK